MVLVRSSAFTLVLTGLVHAGAVKRQSITSLSSNQISSYTPFTYFASTAYCDPSTTINWSCGGASPANSLPPRAVMYWWSSYSQLRSKLRLHSSGVRRRWGRRSILWDISMADLVLSYTYIASAAQGSSDSPRRRTPSLFPTRAPTPANCKLISLRHSDVTFAHPSRQLRRPD